MGHNQEDRKRNGVADAQTESAPIPVVLVSERPCQVILRYLLWILLWGLPAVGCLAMSLMVTVACALGSLLVLVGLALAWFPPWRASRFVLRSGRATVRDGALFLEGQPVVRLDDIQQAQRLPGISRNDGGILERPEGFEGVAVRLWLRGWRRSVVFRTPDDQVALSLIERLGLGPEKRLTTVDADLFHPFADLVLAGLGFGSLALLLLLQPLGLDTTAGSWFIMQVPFIAAPVVTLLYGALRRSCRRKVSVGADGVRVRVFGRTRFTPFAQVAKVERSTRSLALVLTSGKRVNLVNQGPRWSDKTDRVTPVANVVVPAHESYCKRVAEDRHCAALARGGRELEDWQRQLDRLAKGAVDPYRETAVQPEVLWRIAEDPSAPADCRVAAAVVLRAKQGDEASKRLEKAARSIASGDLAKAMTGAAEADEEAEVVDVLQLGSECQYSSKRS